MPASTNASTTAGPAFCAATVPVSTKMPVPMMAPIPSMVRLSAPRARLRLWSVSASVCRSVTLFRRSRFMRPSSEGESYGLGTGARVGPGPRPVKPRRSSDAVVGRFAGDHHVVRMRLSQPSGSDLDELGLGLEGLDVAHAAVSHAAAQAARHLED